MARVGVSLVAVDGAVLFRGFVCFVRGFGLVFVGVDVVEVVVSDSCFVLVGGAAVF